MVSFIELTKSNLRKKILSFAFTNPDVNLYLREFARRIEADPGNLSKELAKLEKEGVFLSQKRGKEKYYCLNKKYPLYKELQSIVFKTTGIKGSLKKLLREIPGIKFAYIYGSYAKNEENLDSDIDMGLLVNIDDFSEEILMEKIKDLEKRLSREVNYMYHTLREWNNKIASKDSFVINILKEPKIMLIGKEDELRRSCI